MVFALDNLQWSAYEVTNLHGPYKSDDYLTALLKIVSY
jgi:hypothetical protein